MKENISTDLPALAGSSASRENAVQVGERVSQWAESWAELFRSSVHDTAIPPVVEPMLKQTSTEASIVPVTPEE